jgi:hypothetical protein
VNKARKRPGFFHDGVSRLVQNAEAACKKRRLRAPHLLEKQVATRWTVFHLFQPLLMITLTETLQFLQ